MIATRGININDKTAPWTELILSGKKKIETRTRNTLRTVLNEPVAVIRTGKGPAMVVGFIILSNPIKYTNVNQFRADGEKHCVNEGSIFDWKGQKYGYHITVLKKLDNPIPVTSRGIINRKIEPYEIR